MAIALRGTPTAAARSGGGIVVINVPTGVVDGDALLLLIEVNASAQSIATPAGWNLLDSQNASAPSVASYWRVASSEPSSYTITLPNTGNVLMVAYSGTDATTPVNAHGAFAINTTTLSQTASSITTTVNGCEIVYLLGLTATGTISTPPTGFASESATATVATYVADEAQGTLGATGTATATLSGTRTGGSTLIALAPGATGPTNTVAPAVTGTAQVNQTVSTDNGTWTGSPTGFTYQWQDSADGSTGWANIASAASSSYSIAVGELNKFLRCQVTATNAGGSTTATSNVVGPVAAAPSLSTILGKTGTSGTAVMQKTLAGWTYVSQKTVGTGTAIAQKTVAGYTKIKGH